MEKFNKTVFDIFKIRPEEIQDSMTAKEIPNWDSMNYLLFMSELEKQFDISFSMDEILNASSLGSIKEMLRQKKADI